MEDSEILSYSTAMMMAVALIVSALLIPFPFLWSYRLSRSIRRFPHRFAFCLFIGMLTYTLVVLMAVIAFAVAKGLSLGGFMGDTVVTPLWAFFRFGWLVTAATTVLSTLWLADYYSGHWRNLVERFRR